MSASPSSASAMNFLRDHAGEQPAPFRPPFVGELLTPRRHRLAAGPRHQITHHARFDVNGFHFLASRVASFQCADFFLR